jgi:hypothetical protein
MAKTKCLAIVRRKGHVDRALALEDRDRLHFVCMSLETFLYCRQYELPVSIPFDYMGINGRDFTIEGRRLSVQWIREVIAAPLDLSPEEQMYLSTQFTFSFAMALFAQELIKALVDHHRPEKVLVWRDTKEPILGDWAPGSEEGAIFSEVVASWLGEVRTPVEFLDLAHQPMSGTPMFGTHRSTDPFGGKLGFCRAYVPKRVRAALWFSYVMGLNFHRFVKQAKVRFRVALLRLQRWMFKQPLMLFWGAHVDAVYQAELAKEWKRKRGWRCFRVESYDPAALLVRKRTRGGAVRLGLSEEVVFNAYNKLEKHRSSWFDQETNPSWPDFRSSRHGAVGWKDMEGILKYQYAAMIRFAFGLRRRILLIGNVLRALKPDCVVTHLDAVVPMAARQAGIPSVAIAHAGFFIPYFASMQGDLNIVGGETQKEFCEAAGQCSGKLVVLGWPHLNLTERKPAPDLDSSSAEPSIIFLAAGELDFYFWDVVNYQLYHATCEMLKELAHTEGFKLIVKLHPRYGNKPLYQDIFKPDGKHVTLENAPNLEKILERSHLAICSGMTTAMFECLGHETPTIFSVYHYGPQAMLTPYHRVLRTGMVFPAGPEELKAHVVRLLRSSAARRAVIRDQDKILPAMMKESGDTVSRRIADLCQDLIQGRPLSEATGAAAGIAPGGVS